MRPYIFLYGKDKETMRQNIEELYHWMSELNCLLFDLIHHLGLKIEDTTIPQAPSNTRRFKFSKRED